MNLTLHGIGPPPPTVGTSEQAMWVTEQQFEAVLAFVADRRDVRLTFDDGNASDVEIALPALVERGLTAEFFPVAARLGRPGSLGEDDLLALDRANMKIGSHGMHHRPWRHLDEEALDEELVGARTILEKALGHRIDDVACPFGWYDRKSLGRLRAAGYRRVFTSDGGSTDSDAWLQSRNTVSGDEAYTIGRLINRSMASAPVARLKRAVKRLR